MYRMNVATALDDNYAKYTYVMLYSLFTNNEDAEIYVYLLQNSLTEESIQNLEKLCDTYRNHLCLLDVNEDTMDQRLLQTDNWTMETCYRLQLFDILPSEVDRLLYLDVDMVINQSVSELYQMDMGDKKIAAVHDSKMRDENIVNSVNEYRDDAIVSLRERDAYFNAGMLLFDVSKLRQKYSYERYISEAEKIGFRLFAPDQDLLNLLHHDEVVWVDGLRYNFFPGIRIDEGFCYEEMKEDVAIIHFIGKKPWSGGNHIHHCLEKIWWDYALETPYKDLFLENYVLDSMTDMSMRDYVKGLINENIQLKNDLKSAIESFQKLAGALK